MKWLWLLLLFPFIAFAEEKAALDYNDFARIPILHEGRIKPLDSFARVSLKKIYGKTSLPDASADEWLAEALFAPARAMQQPIFTVRVPLVISMLALPSRDDALYSFQEMAGAFALHQQFMAALIAKDRKTLSPDEQELIRLYENINDFAEIIGTFSLLLPMPEVDDAMRAELGVSSDAVVTYADMLKIRHGIATELAEVVKRKGDRLNDYTPHEQRLAKASYRMDALEAMGSGNTLLRVMPPAWGGEEWLSPWMVLEKGAGSPASLVLLHEWQNLATAYNKSDALAWKQASEKLRMAPGNVRPLALSLEVAYNAINPLGLALGAYGLGIALAIIGMLLRKQIVMRAATGVVLVGVASHGVGIAARMLILLRPPVSTLYESMIFVSLVTAAFGLWIERKRQNGEGIFISGITAGLLLIAANVFAADSDTLEVLVAVLNTNFWLATHVVCITTGYGASLMVGMLAHLYLIKRALGKNELEALQRRMHRVALVALLFTAVGTMLGGIWADQSWGRFWGWDPKENGALLIVLWLIWLLHGRIAGQLEDLGFAVGTALINMVVGLAWVGVNLLSVGLHSYGFTDIAANGLIAFCVAECIFVTVTTAAIKLRERHIHA